MADDAADDAGEWTTHYDDKGQAYYHNPNTKETSWCVSNVLIGRISSAVDLVLIYCSTAWPFSRLQDAANDPFANRPRRDRRRGRPVGDPP